MINTELKKRILSSIILIPITLFFIIEGNFLFNFFIIICFMITLYEWHKMSYKKPYYLIGLLFLIISFYSAYKIRTTMNGDYIYFIIILLICILTDIGGYIFGKIFKGPKLTSISPNKTVSGSFGSFLFSAIIMSVLFFYFYRMFNLNILGLSLFTSLGCQIGDLFFSFLKRKAKIKDTGNILPGHGGILDRVDGILLGIPTGFISINFFF